ncbi:hypothetical protein PIB30_036534 [Stylosanthes scabra]|uniref:Uncharacterized protein n=1 Tax=Stylosanthes scabra TaxID=79078 RepID=A0ABU6TDN1_9FABA|nr:hypothetical protein [Stylosanthes scabra]
MDFEDVKEAAALINSGGAKDTISGTEDSAVVQQKVVHRPPSNLPSEGGGETRSLEHALGGYRLTPVFSNSADLDAVEKGEARGALDSAVKSHAVAAMTDTEDLRTTNGVLHRVCPVVSRPPPLLATVFPWDHRESSRDLLRWGAALDFMATANGVRFSIADPAATHEPSKEKCNNENEEEERFLPPRLGLQLISQAHYKSTKVQLVWFVFGTSLTRVLGRF